MLHLNFPGTGFVQTMVLVLGPAAVCALAAPVSSTHSLILVCSLTVKNYSLLFEIE